MILRSSSISTLKPDPSRSLKARSVSNEGSIYPYHQTEETRHNSIDRAIRREVWVGDETYTLTIDPTGLKLVMKGRRKGLELQWTGLVDGDAALVAALQASLAAKRIQRAPQESDLALLQLSR